MESASAPGLPLDGVPLVKAPPRASARIVFIDLARAITIIVMVMGHSLHAMLDATYRDTTGYRIWSFFRGFTSPMFLVVAGLSFSVATMRYWEHHARLSGRVLQRARRSLGFVALGYILHWPVSQFADFGGLALGAWQSFLQVDVLQVIGVTLIMLQLCVLFSKTQSRFTLVSLLMCVGIFAVTPVMYLVPWAEHLPLGLAAYLYAATGSAFPFFGWSGYIFAGATLGMWLFRQRSGPIEDRDLFRIAVRFAGLGALLLGWGLTLRFGIKWRLYPRPPISRCKVQFNLNRLGGALLQLSLFTLVSRHLRALPDLLQRLSSESLVVYLVHLAVVYGCIWFGGLREWLGPTLSVAQALGVVILVELAMVALAWLWSTLKRDYPRQQLWARYAIVGGIVVSLLR